MAPDKKGVFGQNPVAEPLYVKSEGVRQNYDDTMARLYLYLTPAQEQAVKKYAKNTPATDLVDKLSVEVGKGGGYIDFLLQEVNHNFSELVDVYDTLAHKYVSYAFGAAPRVFSYSALLLNNKEQNQAENLLTLYWYVLRAERLAHLNLPVHLAYNNTVVTGSFLDLEQAYDSSDEGAVRASFRMLVRRVSYLKNDAYAPGEYTLSQPIRPTKASHSAIKTEAPAETPAPPVVAAAPDAATTPAGAAPPSSSASEGTSALGAARLSQDFDNRRLNVFRLFEPPTTF